MANDDNCYKKREGCKIEIPEDVNMPFFAYGVFKSGQLAYPRIKDYIDGEPVKSKTKYPLKNINGVPILLKNDGDYDYGTLGELLYFKTDYAEDMYEIIRSVKTKSLYIWDTITVKDLENDENIKANVLIGYKPKIDKPLYENWVEYDWKKDLTLSEVINIIYNKVHKVKVELKDTNKVNVKDFFTLQMNYMLLWSAIDRYLNLKYGFNKQWENLVFLSEEEIFKKAILKHIPDCYETPVVYSHEDLRDYELDKQRSLCCLRYYYAIRCNVVHSGKSCFMDFEVLAYSLCELLNILKDVLADTFGEEHFYKKPIKLWKRV